MPDCIIQQQQVACRPRDDAGEASYRLQAGGILSAATTVRSRLASASAGIRPLGRCHVHTVGEKDAVREARRKLVCGVHRQGRCSRSRPYRRSHAYRVTRSVTGLDCADKQAQLARR